MKYLWCALFSLIFTTATAQNLALSDETTEVRISTTQGSDKLEGSFKGVAGSAYFHPEQIQNCFLQLSFKPGKFSTTDKQAAPGIVKNECFDVADFPTIDLASSSITSKGKDKYHFRGNLTIKGISRQVSFPFTAEKKAGGYDFDFDFSIMRKHFNLDCSSMSKDIKFSVNAYGKRK